MKFYNGTELECAEHMRKKNAIIILTLISFTTLIFSPFLMISCIETDGTGHLENIFNRCCSSTMLGIEHKHAAAKELSFSGSRCLCSTDFGSQTYIVPKYNTNSPNISFKLNNVFEEDHLIRNNYYSIYTSESPPLSISLVKTTILLI